MSRVGRQPIAIPDGVKVTVNGSDVSVEGPRGRLARTVHPEMTVRVKDAEAVVERPSDSKTHKSLHGLSRKLIANMVEGVSKGFEKVLELRGTGYRAEMKGQKIVLGLGFSHPVEKDVPAGIEMEVERMPMIDAMAITHVTIRGVDKELVGQVAAELRRIRPPEPYKGKGIRYLGEYVRRKAGKAAT